MNSALLKYGLIGLAVAGFFGYSWYQDNMVPQSADLGQVLDRTEYALSQYSEASGPADAGAAGEATDAQMAEFTEFLTAIMNAQPTFYDDPIGVNLQDDAMFLGFKDPNANNIQDSGEGKIFTIEIDSANERLIATDVAGDAASLRFSGAGFLTGLVIGNLLSRQSRAGIAPGSFNNRQATPRNAYQAKSSARSRARSGGSRSGK